MSTRTFEFVIVGGGIAGVICTETLCQLLEADILSYQNSNKCVINDFRVCLISSSKTLKTTVNVRHLTRYLEMFDLVEKSSDDFSTMWPNILTVIIDTVDKLVCRDNCLYLHNGDQICYGRLCLATGGIPRLVQQNHPLVITLRDTESIFQFKNRLAGARRVLLIGNGGIATEVAYEIVGCQVIWVVKHENISVPFLDAAAAQFLLKSREKRMAETCALPPEEVIGREKDSKNATLIRTLRYTLAERGHHPNHPPKWILVDREGKVEPETLVGSALGPDWSQGQIFAGAIDSISLKRPLKVIYKAQVDCLYTPAEFTASGLSTTDWDAEGTLLSGVSEWPLYVRLTNSQVYGCDLLISAIGVDANLGADSPSGAKAFTAENPDLATAGPSVGGGILVNEYMQSSLPNVYAAGDCAYASWKPAPHWFQMRLWSQARQTAFQAAKSMYFHALGHLDVPLDFSFEMFSHVTFFFGFKIILLGLFNGQGLDLTDSEYEILLRISPDIDFVKCLMRNGRMQGALLIGDTDLEETFENLILNQLDLSQFGEHFLNPDIDISDYFD